MRFAPRNADQGGIYTPLKHDLRREQQNPDRFLNQECIEGFGEICVRRMRGGMLETLNEIWKENTRERDYKRKQREEIEKDFQSGSDGKGLNIYGLDQNKRYGFPWFQGSERQCHHPWISCFFKFFGFFFILFFSLYYYCMYLSGVPVLLYIVYSE